MSEFIRRKKKGEESEYTEEPPDEIPTTVSRVAFQRVPPSYKSDVVRRPKPSKDRDKKKD